MLVKGVFQHHRNGGKQDNDLRFQNGVSAFQVSFQFKIITWDRDSGFDCEYITKYMAGKPGLASKLIGIKLYTFFIWFHLKHISSLNPALWKYSKY